MGWLDDPLVEQSATPAQPSFMNAPEVEPTTQGTPDQGMGGVLKNAVPKAFANILNAPITLGDLIMQGIASLPMAGHLKGLQEAAANPELKQNAPLDLMGKLGLYDPAREPQTGPQRIVDTAIQAAVGGAIVPGASIMGAVKGAAVGAVSGAVAQTAKEISKPALGETGSTLLAVAVGAATPMVLKAATDSSKKILLNPTEKMTLQEAQQYGFVVEPSRVRKGTDVREAVAGKASIAQEASIRNQPIANNMTDTYLGLPEGTPITKPILGEIRKQAGKAYEEVAKLSDDAATALEELKQVRSDARAAYRAYAENANPAFLAEYKKLHASAETWEKFLEDTASAAGKPDLIPRLHAARTMIARTYDVQDVLNIGSGNVSMPKIGKMLQDGVPLSGEFEVIGKFARAFPRVAREVEGVPPSGVSGTDAFGSAVMSMQGAAAANSPAGLMAGGLPMLRGPAREKVLSPSYQKELLTEPKPSTPMSTAVGRSAVTGAIVEENQP